MILRIRPVDRRSAGLGGSGPLGSSHRLACWVSHDMAPEADFVSPSAACSGQRLSVAALKAGFLRSLSSKSTDAPRLAKFCATASADEDLAFARRACW